MIFAQSYKNLSYLQKKKENFFSFIKFLTHIHILSCIVEKGTPPYRSVPFIF